jgi:AraC-like DNA-binding protein
VSTIQHEMVRYERFPIPGIEAMTASSRRVFGKHTHDQYAVGIIDDGGQAWWSGRGGVEAVAGSLISLNPGEVHDGRPLTDAGRSWRMLYMDPPLLAAFCADVNQDRDSSFTFAAPAFADEIARQRLEAVFALRGKGRGSTAMACETAMLQLVASLQPRSVRGPLRRARATPAVERARERIDADPAAALTLTELARDADLSRYQLLRGFARTLGLTPHAYILQRRVELARRLICAGCALTEVAYRAGFYDQSHLTRCFVRQFGITPGRYTPRQT